MQNPRAINDRPYGYFFDSLPVRLSVWGSFARRTYFLPSVTVSEVTELPYWSVMTQ